MANLVLIEEVSTYLCGLVYDIKENGFDKEKVESILRRIMSRDENGDIFLKYRVSDKSVHTAIFIPQYEVIEVSIKRLNSWLDINTRDLAEMYEIDDKDLLRSYLVLMVLMHEVEHSNQYLISLGKIEAPCVAIKDAYSILFGLLKRKDYILPRPIKQVRRTLSIISYKRRENEFLLERNAQFNSLRMLSNIAFYNGDMDIRDLLLDMRNVFAVAGYTENTDGTLINTFKSIFMKDKLKKINQGYENMDMMERYEWGLPIDEETRKRVLTKTKTTHYE